MNRKVNTKSLFSIFFTKELYLAYGVFSINNQLYIAQKRPAE